MPEEIIQNTSSELVENSSSKSNTQLEDPKHPLSVPISSFLHRVQDIELGLLEFVPLAKTRTKEELESLKTKLEEIANELKGDYSSKKALLISETLKTIKQLERLMNSNVPGTLKASLFLGLFSAYDAFTGELLSAIFLKKPELFNSMSRSILVSEVMSFKTFDDFKESELRKEIETFRRNSYIEQFEYLEKTFGLKLKMFKNWPTFIECSQRRNLITHCNGIVSPQYLEICKKELVPLPSDVTLSKKIGLEDDYLLRSCTLMMEVAIKLGMTLWRKIFPEDIDVVDQELNEIIYNFLHKEKWNFASELGEFSLTLRDMSDLNRKFIVVNCAIALRFGGEERKAADVIGNEDWSAAVPDFKLAKEILLGNFERSAELMKMIGKKGQYVKQESYNIWPLFKEFRQTQIFFDAYEKLYGHPFVQDLSREVDKAKTKADEETPNSKKESLNSSEN